VASFLAANLYSVGSLRAIDRESDAIAGNAAPAIERLDRARSALRQMETSASLAFASAIDGLPIDRRFFLVDDAKLHVALSRYLALPSDPGERALYRQMNEHVDDFERSVEHLLGMLERGELREARQLSRLEMHTRAARAAEEIEQLIERNADELTQATRRIARLRGRITAISYTLQLLATMVAAGLLILSVRAMRDWARLSNARRELAEERAQEMEQFAGRIAHDLKNPLTAMGMRVVLAERRGDPATFAKLAQQVRSMSQLIDGLLEFAVSGARPAPGAHTDVGGVVDEVVGAINDEAQAGGTEIVVAVEAGVSVACSRAALLSIVGNLVRNAVKYVAGQPRRHVDVRVRDGGSGRVRLEVEDSGPGIPAEQRGHIFEPFVRLDGTRKQPGFGLGLATVKKLVGAYGGEIGVGGGAGEVGACFWLSLPRA
jgi:signal transduction histidine kinase